MNNIFKRRCIFRSSNKKTGENTSKGQTFILPRPQYLDLIKNTEELQKLKAQLEKIKEDKTNCTICQEPVKEADSVKTECGHHFCMDCFWPWCKTSNQCPNCRADLMKKDRKAELNLLDLLDRRAEIRKEVQEMYEELDDRREELKLQRMIQNIEKNTLQLLRSKIVDDKDILDEIEMYKRNPKKAMKMFDCRQEKLGKRIYNKTKQLQQQVMRELNDKFIHTNWPNIAFNIIETRKNTWSKAKQKTFNRYMAANYTNMEEVRFTEYELNIIFKEDETGYKLAATTKCSCEFCNNCNEENKWLTCSQHWRFCQTHKQPDCVVCNYCDLCNYGRCDMCKFLDDINIVEVINSVSVSDSDSVSDSECFNSSDFELSDSNSSDSDSVMNLDYIEDLEI